MRASPAGILPLLRPLLIELREDLVERAGAKGVKEELQAAHRKLREEHRTAEPFELWLGERAAQIAAAWMLSILFVRVLEDRELLERRRIAGPGAEDSESQFNELAPFLTPRDYLLTVFRELSRLPGVRHVFDARHNPVWALGPSGAMAGKLVKFFRQTDGEGKLALSFAGRETRFLGDLYQDLYEDIREKYALLQTPEFVEEFILDETLDPAIQTFGLDKVRVIDPTCGSGHFLLGAFRRLFLRWVKERPGDRLDALAQRALKQVAGVDLNPYAVAIARFRLTLAFLELAGVAKLKRAPELELDLCVGDSLLFGLGQLDLASRVGREHRASWLEDRFLMEDADEAERILGARYQAVVGNPPYITVSDEELNQKYRKNFKSCHRGYQLVAPFVERFFCKLAAPGGYVGAIVGNGFMKREFGTKLITEVLSKVDLTHVVDTSGAYIPGHGTPTVILCGRNQARSDAPVLAVLGNRGEPSTPDDPSKGLVWSSIRAHHREVGFEDEYISVALIPRERFDAHPWSLSGGGASTLMELLEKRASKRLNDLGVDIGRTAHTGEDSAFFVPASFVKRTGARDFFVPLIKGEQVRDYALAEGEETIFPYERSSLVARFPDQLVLLRHFWSLRTVLRDRQDFGEKIEDRGLSWFEYSMFFRERFRIPLSIAFAEVATHNHFVLDRGGKIFKQTAPIIKLPAGATKDEHLALLGYLNSSTACFWMKQVFFDKGNRGEGGGVTAESWEKFFAHDGTKLKACPCPAPSPRVLHLARLLDAAAQEFARTSPSDAISEWLARGGALRDVLGSFRRKREALEAKVRWLQEELDWTVYALFGLSDLPLPEVPKRLDEVPQRARGSRPSDKLYAEKALAGEVTERYFQLCHLPAARDVLAMPLDEVDRQRIAAIRDSHSLSLIETPTCKRTFREGHRPWAPETALREAIAVLVEEEVRHGTSVNRLTSFEAIASLKQESSKLSSLVAVLNEISGANATPEQLVREILLDEAVPFLAAYRYSESGMERRKQWEETWELQRREDAGEKLHIPVPNKYDRKDFAKPTYWQLRGKLDVPKERFISYPGAESDDDDSPLFGWAGWDHLQQATALAGLYQQRKNQEGWKAERLIPLLAGLLELLPWLKQWHNEPDPNFGGQRLGDFYATFLDGELRFWDLDRDALRAWRPEKGRRGAAKAMPKPQAEAKPRKPAIDAEMLLAAIREVDSGGGADLAALSDKLGAAKPTLSKLAASLVEEGKLRETSGRPKRWALVQS